MIIRVGASPDNELRVIWASAISCTKARVTGDDDFVTFDQDEYASLLLQNSQPRTALEENTPKRRRL